MNEVYFVRKLRKIFRYFYGAFIHINQTQVCLENFHIMREQNIAISSEEVIYKKPDLIPLW